MPHYFCLSDFLNLLFHNSKSKIHSWKLVQEKQNFKSFGFFIFGFNSVKKIKLKSFNFWKKWEVVEALISCGLSSVNAFYQSKGTFDLTLSFTVWSWLLAPIFMIHWVFFPLEIFSCPGFKKVEIFSPEWCNIWLGCWWTFLDYWVFVSVLLLVKPFVFSSTEEALFG